MGGNHLNDLFRWIFRKESKKIKKFEESVNEIEDEKVRDLLMRKFKSSIKRKP